MPKKRPTLTDADGEVRELMKADLRSMQPFYEVHPELAPADWTPPRRRGPQRTPTKERITIRLSREVLDHYRATGRGRQARLRARRGSGGFGDGRRRGGPLGLRRRP